jgi:diguanylate cyclase (GGDEF)-like protein
MTELGSSFDDKHAESRYRHLRLFATLGIMNGLVSACVFYWLGFWQIAVCCLLYGLFCLTTRWLTARHRQLTGLTCHLGIFATLLLTSIGPFFQTQEVFLAHWVMTIPVIAYVLCRRKYALLWAGFTMLWEAGIYLIWPAVLPGLSLLMICAALTASAAALHVFAIYLEGNEQLIVTLSNTDSLTDTLNRRSFPAVLEAEARRNWRQRTALSVTMVDVDFFKQYNDHYGHVRGDDVLVRVAQALKEVAQRSGDYVFRYGGEEFCVLCSGLNAAQAEEQAQVFAERLRTEVEALGLEHVGSSFGKVTVSVGCHCSDTQHPVEPHRLVEAADKALYQAKLHGRNRVEFSDNDAMRSALRA